MSAFDLDTFMDSTTTEAGSTSFNQVPAGEYAAVIKSIGDKDGKPRRVPTKDGERTMLDLTWELINVDQAILDEVGRDSLTVRQSLWLDVTSQGTLDMGKGKNVGLNQVRDAVGQNVAGQPWGPKNLIGAGPALIRVDHRFDKNDPTKVYVEVKKVARYA